MRMMLNLPQRRTKGDVYFNRDWESYKNGFGEPDGDFWLGNEAVHILTYVVKIYMYLFILWNSVFFFFFFAFYCVT